MVSRVGTRIYLSVGGHNPRSAFAVDSLTAQRDPGNRPVLAAKVHNTGGRALDLTGTLTLTSSAGGLHTTAGPYAVRLGTTLAPGQSEHVTTVITDRLADGPWKATLKLQSGLLTGTSQATITFPHTIGSAAPVAAHSKTTARHLTMIGITVAVVALLAAAGVAIVRRRRTHAP
jgi:hypothetical protein